MVGEDLLRRSSELVVSVVLFPHAPFTCIPFYHCAESSAYGGLFFSFSVIRKLDVGGPVEDR
jgi:hypothetical protein